MSGPGYLSIGSNVGDRAEHLRACVDAFGEHGIEVEAVSTVYATEPVGLYPDQRDFLNAAVCITTDLEPLALLDLCKAIEVERGRAFAGPRHGPRPLDVDLLLLGEAELRHERLTLPHPGLTERRFVLEPLLEIEPGLALPDGTALAPLLERLGDQRVEPLGALAELADDDQGFHSSGSAAGA
jgi:2-amino-4-hydroxy-6-hydroxymethyldihydropteridine diphosphokinase